jgi:hypothetical protein
MRSSLALVTSLLVLGCGNAANEAGSPSASAAASPAPAASSPPPTTSAVAPPAPDDLDAASAQKALKCGNDTKAAGACGVLAKFAGCKPWNPVTPGGDGRWIGRGVEVDKGKSTEVFVMVRAKRAPTSEVGPGQLGAKVAIEELPKSDKDAYDAADRAIRILERQDVAPRFNPTLDYLKKREQWNDSFATATAGGQVYLLSKGGGFVCVGPKQQLLVVQRAAARGANADGIYAEVWATSW